MTDYLLRWLHLRYSYGHVDGTGFISCRVVILKVAFENAFILLLNWLYLELLIEILSLEDVHIVLFLFQLCYFVVFP